ncbi:MAG: PQQ-dependent sugar dehydrogenase [Calditrichia bacterium]
MRIWFFAIIMMFVLQDNSPAQYSLQNAFPNLSFSQPLELQHPGDGTDRLFVVEKTGRIQVFLNDSSTTHKQLFLDISSRVNSSGSEEGLLGLAFHPQYQSNGYFYVDYTASNPRRSVISRFTVSTANPDSADENSELVLLEVNQPYSNHNGGKIAFGPDNYLYISLGDGGSAGDPDGNGQNPNTLLGSILRIDVDNPAGSLNYGIPPDNPFVNSTGGRDEVFAYGLRNPWRFSFDPATGMLWAGDVGQSQWEEVDIIQNGGNYGWNVMEGFHCYGSSSCDTTGLTLPVREYGHNSSGGISITGGYVYRGSRVPQLQGKYVYGDYGSGRLWALTLQPGQDTSNVLLLNSSLNISSFGIDEENELYLTAFNGNIYRFKSTATDIEPPDQQPAGFYLGQNYPNPFNPSTTIPLTLHRSGRVKLSVFNVNGEKICDILNDRLSAGVYEFGWNGRNLQGDQMGSGLYFINASVGGERQVRSMLLLR